MIKVTLGAAETQKEKPFPKLMTLKKLGGIFLFGSEKECVCIVPDKGNRVKAKWSIEETCSDYVAINEFTDYNEPITIQNA